jgi:hypothetical protein
MKVVLVELLARVMVGYGYRNLRVLGLFENWVHNKKGNAILIFIYKKKKAFEMRP